VHHAVAFQLEQNRLQKLDGNVLPFSDLIGLQRCRFPVLRQRVNAGLAALRKQSGVDSSHIAAIGYCFGGTGVLELARTGADVAGVVSFHGGLSTPDPAVPEQRSWNLAATAPI
jgi:dienelactone hydrolase